MNTLVCISHVPDTTTKITFDASGAALNKNGVSFVIGPFDEYALSWAVDRKEKNPTDKITVLCVGGADVEPTIRKALAVGADEGVRIDGQARDAFYIAKQIAEYAKDKNFDLITFGKESIEHNDAAVGPMVAELLGLPFAHSVTELTVDGSNVTATREIEGGVEVLKAPTPFCLSSTKGIAEWKIPNMRGIMAARTKPLAVVPAAGVQAKVRTLKYDNPPAKQGVQMIAADNVQQLVTVLHDKGVI